MKTLKLSCPKCGADETNAILLDLNCLERRQVRGVRRGIHGQGSGLHLPRAGGALGRSRPVDRQRTRDRP
jgi:hypothetical protein